MFSPEVPMTNPGSKTPKFTLGNQSLLGFLAEKGAPHKEGAL